MSLAAVTSQLRLYQASKTCLWEAIRWLCNTGNIISKQRVIEQQKRWRHTKPHTHIYSNTRCCLCLYRDALLHSAVYISTSFTEPSVHFHLVLILLKTWLPSKLLPVKNQDLTRNTPTLKIFWPRKLKKKLPLTKSRRCHTLNIIKHRWHRTSSAADECIALSDLLETCYIPEHWHCNTLGEKKKNKCEGQNLKRFLWVFAFIGTEDVTKCCRELLEELQRLNRSLSRAQVWLRHRGVKWIFDVLSLWRRGAEERGEHS